MLISKKLKQSLKKEKLKKSKYEKALRSHFVAPNNKRHLSAPGVDERRPAGVEGQIFSAAGAHPQRRVVKRLPGELKDWKQTTERVETKPRNR